MREGSTASPLHGPVATIRRAGFATAVLLGLYGTADLQAQDCLGSYDLTFSPLPVNSTYTCGQTVTFCLTIDSWNTTNSNWLHGIVPSFGPGWDLSTLTPGSTPPTVGTSDGTWGWYATDDGTSGNSVGPVGPGFFFDLDNDGDPGNNFGDYAETGPWTFCFTISVLSGADCIGGTDLSVSINTYGDSETGSWGSPGCGGDEIPVNPPTQIMACPNPGTSYTLPLCSSDPPTDLFPGLGGDAGGVWTGPGGSPSTGVVDPATGPQGSYTYTLTPTSSDCVQLSATVDVVINRPPNAGTNGQLRLCERAMPADLFTSLGGTPDATGYWADPTGAPSSGTVDPAAAMDGPYTYTVMGLAPCPNAVATVDLIVDHMPDPGVSTTRDLCPEVAPVDLFLLLGPAAAPGGTWTDPSGMPAASTFPPATGEPGLYTYTLQGSDACAGELVRSTVEVSVFQAPSAAFSFSPDKGCVPLDVAFRLQGVTGIVATKWSFGDGLLSTQAEDVMHTYERTGTFTPGVEVTDQNGCRKSALSDGPIRVYPAPSASFHYAPFPLTTLFNTATTFEAWQDSLHAYSWNIAGQALEGRTIHFGFPPATATTYPVCLTVVDTLGCTAETCDEVIVHESFNVNVPNAFTPNGDGDNDVFAPVIIGENEQSLSLEIFDRAGTPVYSAVGKPGVWNGAKDNAGSTLPQGVYVWRLVVQDALTAEREELIGHVTLLK